ncbi:MAG: RecQ family ATP-dependent DNA helicase [Cyanobacteria bacterium J06642_2]
MPDALTSIRTHLKTYWGYDRLKSPQAEVIQAQLDSRDCLIVLPTGFGKSLCFQLPAVMQGGLTLVVSPLIALMNAQVTDLQQRGLAAAALHGQLSQTQRRRVLSQLDRQQLRLLYASPETLLSPPVWQRLLHPAFIVNGLIVDEAHTLVHWGSSFRPDYCRLAAVRTALQKSFPIAAFTATADAATRTTLTSVLQLRDPFELKMSPQRSHLSLNIQVAWTVAGRRRQCLHFIHQQRGTSGLVYVRTRVTGRELSQWLTQQGLSAALYHGGLPAATRRQLESEWLSGQRSFLVCTNAFGMGVDLPTVRWVLHYQPPLTLTDYVQEVGRAGRDGKPARALMLVSEPTGWLDDSDRRLHDFFRQQTQQHYQQAARLLRQLPDSGEYERTVRELGADVKVALAMLHQARCLSWRDPFHFQIERRPQQLSSASSGDNLSMKIEDLVSARGCRWQHILSAFGYADADACGICDRCRKLKRRSTRT